MARFGFNRKAGGAKGHGASSMLSPPATRDELVGLRTVLERKAMILEALRGAPCPMTAGEVQQKVASTQGFYLKKAETRGFLIGLEKSGHVRQFGQGEMATSRWEGVYKYGPLWGPKEPE